MNKVDASFLWLMIQQQRWDRNHKRKSILPLRGYSKEGSCASAWSIMGDVQLELTPELNLDPALVGFCQLYINLHISGKRASQLRKHFVVLAYWQVLNNDWCGMGPVHWLWYLPWAGGPVLHKKECWVSHGEQAKKQHPSMIPVSGPVFRSLFCVAAFTSLSDEL